MDDDHLDRLIDSLAPLLDLAIDPVWRPAIRTHLRLSLGHADNVLAFPLPDDLDPAPIFHP